MPVQAPMDPNRLYWASASAGPNPQRLRLPIDNPCGLSGSRRLWDRRQFGQQCTRNVLFHIPPLVIFKSVVYRRESISCRISATRQTATREPSFTGFGNRPDLTPAHHVDFFIGRTAARGFRGPRFDIRFDSASHSVTSVTPSI